MSVVIYMYILIFFINVHHSTVNVLEGMYMSRDHGAANLDQGWPSELGRPILLFIIISFILSYFEWYHVCMNRGIEIR